MCGICGEVRWDGHLPSAQRVEAMTQAMEPRGPDAAGIASHGNASFGHRRLKIIDLSDRAQQPMVDSDLGLTLVFNGCIYNYKDLRRELADQGYRFFSDGDTEVVLKAYHAWGEAFVSRLNGMFAFAIRERDSGRVLLGRDRLGIKPLYVSETGKTMRFASSLPAILAAGEADTSIDATALHHYMMFHAVVPAPLTILKGVRKLPPATLRVYEADGTSRDKVYWRANYDPSSEDEACSLEEWETRVLETLTRSVRRRMVADVPVGVLLSGGVDSSLIVGLLANEGQRHLNTFSIGFDNVDGEDGNEFVYSDLIAQKYETDHHKIHIPPERLISALPMAIGAMSEPMVSHDAVAFFMLSEEVSKHLKVVQSGQGADEIFAGYHWYPPMATANDPVAEYAQVFFDRAHAEYGEAVQDTWSGPDVSRQFVEAHFSAEGASAPLGKALRLDTNVMLVDDPVKRVDNMTMAWGLEARVPFLDHELVELAARIPGRHHLSDNGKGVLKGAARRVIPSEVIDRPKGYFPVPALKYLEGPFFEMVQDALGSKACKERGLFRQSYVDKLMADPKAHITPLRGSKLWQIALLELWFQSHNL